LDPCNPNFFHDKSELEVERFLIIKTPLFQALVGGDGITLQNKSYCDEFKRILLQLKPSLWTRGHPCCRLKVGIWTSVTVTFFMINLNYMFCVFKIIIPTLYQPLTGWWRYDHPKFTVTNLNAYFCCETVTRDKRASGWARDLCKVSISSFDSVDLKKSPADKISCRGPNSCFIARVWGGDEITLQEGNFVNWRIILKKGFRC
jgi:hypothetical protein